MQDEQRASRTSATSSIKPDPVLEVFRHVAAEEALRDAGWPMTEAEVEATRGDYQEAAVEAQALQPQSDLFPEGEVAPKRRTPTLRRRPDAALVRAAYLHVTREGRESIDRVVADPDLNLKYVQACWSLGGAGDPFQLNRLLLNARKAGRLRPLPPARRLRLPASVLDECLTAVELAVRMVQDRAFFRGTTVTLDRILCDPVYGREFEEYADILAPGRQVFDYRWTALSLRKRVALGRRVGSPIRRCRSATRVTFSTETPTALTRGRA